MDMFELFAKIGVVGKKKKLKEDEPRGYIWIHFF